MGQVLYYGTVAACVFGCVMRIVLAMYYRILLKSLKSMKTTKNRWMKKLKEQFILRYQAMLGVQNVESFVDNFLAERRLFGITLDGWRAIHFPLVSLCLLLGSVAGLYNCVMGQTTKYVLMAMFQGIWTSALLLVVDGFCMVQGKADALKYGLLDYLENYLKIRLEHEYHVWGKDREELRQTKAVLDAQTKVIDVKAYAREKKLEKKQEKRRGNMAKRCPRVEKKVRQDVLRIKQEIEAQRKLEAAAAELEQTASRQVEEILQGLF